MRYISKIGGKVMVVMVVMRWEVLKTCNGSNEVLIGLQNDHVVMKMTQVVMMQ